MIHFFVNKGLVSEENVVLHRWGSKTQKFGFVELWVALSLYGERWSYAINGNMAT